MNQPLPEDVPTAEQSVNREKFALLKQALNVVGFSNMVSRVIKYFPEKTNLVLIYTSFSFKNISGVPIIFRMLLEILMIQQRVVLNQCLIEYTFSWGR